MHDVKRGKEEAICDSPAERPMKKNLDKEEEEAFKSSTKVSQSRDEICRELELFEESLFVLPLRRQ